MEDGNDLFLRARPKTPSWLAAREYQTAQQGMMGEESKIGKNARIKNTFV